MKLRMSALLAAASVALSPAAGAQAPTARYEGDARNTIVVPDAGVGGGINNPRYLPPASNLDYSGIVNLWFRDKNGDVASGCTGSLLAGSGGYRILTAGHCVSNNSDEIVWSSFTARFRNPTTGLMDEINGTGFTVQQNYSGAVLEEQDVAILEMSQPAPAYARAYSLFSGNPMVAYTMAGYGRIGDGLNGDNTSANQFGAINVLRSGRNRFESTCNDSQVCATVANPNASGFGGILLSDFDDIDGSDDSFTCFIGFCDNGFGLDEVAIGRGDSGSAAFSLNTWDIIGVASWGSSLDGISVSQYGMDHGYACVANFADNAACLANYRFVQANLVPEPATYALLGAGLIGVFGIARRRNARS